MSSFRTIYIGVLGVGGVGKAFFAQLADFIERNKTLPVPKCSLSLVLIQRTSSCVLSEYYTTLPHHYLESHLDASQDPPLSVEDITKFLRTAPGPAILVDNTSSEIIAEAYPLFLRAGINIITPNKKAFSGSYQLWQDIHTASQSIGGGHFYHESSVGAGLPIISTLKDLIRTGDEVLKIEGVFSGTLSFLFNNFSPVKGGGGSFSAEVQKAKDLGYTEPDPRDDLNGLDVARKVTILARLLSLPIGTSSPESFPIESLIASELLSCTSGAEYLEKLPQHDAEPTQLRESAAAEGKVLRYVGSIDVASAKLSVGLQRVSLEDPIAGLKGSDNIVSFYTRRYGDTPLVIQGAGAGAAVTAMGVMSDLIKVLERLDAI
ncbi:MAG: hypothetical protein M1829_001884 [Trizodia sp. TS-e1964]|nr:MAG: hypothetical protein M1829_001884 [Trizodia sp. TS-e1964]